MKIHYNNGEKERIIDNVLSVMIVDVSTPATVLLSNGKELTISLNNVEMILDDAIFERRAE